MDPEFSTTSSIMLYFVHLIFWVKYRYGLILPCVTPYEIAFAIFTKLIICVKTWGLSRDMGWNATLAFKKNLKHAYYLLGQSIFLSHKKVAMVNNF